MAGKMNWTRVAKQRVIQERGHEAIAGRDRALPHDGPDWTRQLGPKKQKKKLKHEMTPAERTEQEQARTMRRLEAAEAKLKKERESLEKLAKIERLKRQKAEEKERQMRLSAEFEAKLKQMTTEERVAFEQSQFTRVYRKRKPVTVEHAPLKPKAVRGLGKGDSKAQRKGGGIP
jgi:hypothetical protein